MNKVNSNGNIDNVALNEMLPDPYTEDEIQNRLVAEAWAITKPESSPKPVAAATPTIMHYIYRSSTDFDDCDAVRANVGATGQPSEFRWCSPCGILLKDNEPCAKIAAAQVSGNVTGMPNGSVLSVPVSAATPSCNIICPIHYPRWCACPAPKPELIRPLVCDGSRQIIEPNPLSYDESTIKAREQLHAQAAFRGYDTGVLAGMEIAAKICDDVATAMRKMEAESYPGAGGQASITQECARRIYAEISHRKEKI